jgi:hypothetical protein
LEEETRPKNQKFQKFSNAPSSRNEGNVFPGRLSHSNEKFRNQHHNEEDFNEISFNRGYSHPNNGFEQCETDMIQKEEKLFRKFPSLKSFLTYKNFIFLNKKKETNNLSPGNFSLKNFENPPFHQPSPAPNNFHFASSLNRPLIEQSSIINFQNHPSNPIQNNNNNISLENLNRWNNEERMENHFTRKFFQEKKNKVYEEFTEEKISNILETFIQ